MLPAGSNIKRRCSAQSTDLTGVCIPPALKENCEGDWVTGPEDCGRVFKFCLKNRCSAWHATG